MVLRVCDLIFLGLAHGMKKMSFHAHEAQDFLIVMAVIYALSVSSVLFSSCEQKALY